MSGYVENDRESGGGGGLGGRHLVLEGRRSERRTTELGRHGFSGVKLGVVGLV